eukprot:1576457-Alexandrium_andersonii.AAC.1
MDGVEAAWKAAERATALRSNEDKTQRWLVCREGRSWKVVGQPAKALGIELPTRKVGPSKRDLDKLSERNARVRNAARLP